MINKNIVNDLTEKLSNLLPEDFKDDTKQHIHSVISATLDKLDLVTREEFDVQAKVLARTREKIEALEKQIEALESNCS